MASECLCRKLATKFPGHDTLNVLHDGRKWAFIVRELLTAIVNADAGTLAYVLVIPALVDILKPSPTTYVIDQNGRKIRAPRLNVVEQLLERSAPADTEATFSLVGVSANNLYAFACSVGMIGGGLESRRVFLMSSRFAKILSRADHVWRSV